MLTQPVPRDAATSTRLRLRTIRYAYYASPASYTTPIAEFGLPMRKKGRRRAVPQRRSSRRRRPPLTPDAKTRAPPAATGSSHVREVMSTGGARDLAPFTRRCHRRPNRPLSPTPAPTHISHICTPSATRTTARHTFPSPPQRTSSPATSRSCRSSSSRRRSPLQNLRPRPSQLPSHHPARRARLQPQRVLPMAGAERHRSRPKPRRASRHSMRPRARPRAPWHEQPRSTSRFSARRPVEPSGLF